MLKKPPEIGGLTHKIRKIVFSYFRCPVFAFSVSRFSRELRAAILRYEPRINMLRVSVKDAHHQTLALSLEAMLQDESEPLRLEIAYSNGRWRELTQEGTPGRAFNITHKQ